MTAFDKNISLELCNIPANTIFRFLDIDELQELMLARKCFQYKKGDCIIQCGHRVTGFFCLNSGVVKIVKYGDSGREQIIKFLKTGDVYGYQYLLDDDQLPGVSVIAVDDCGLCFIPSEHLFHMIRSNPKFAIEIMKVATQEQEEMINRLTDIAQKKVKQRLAKRLIEIEKTFGTDDNGYLNLALTREEYANFVGTATETVIRLMAVFKSEGCIKMEKRKIAIRNMQKLQQISREFD